MPVHHVEELPVELEPIAAAAAELIRAQADDDDDAVVLLRRHVAEAASAAIASGASLSAIADAERTGHERARSSLGPDALKRVARAAVRKRAAEDEHEREVIRAGRIGLAHRDIAAAAGIVPATVRALVVRGAPQPENHFHDDHGPTGPDHEEPRDPAW